MSIVLIVCAISLPLFDGHVRWRSVEDVEGKLLNETKEYYVVDFTDTLKKLKLVERPEAYKKIPVRKQECYRK